MTLAPLHKSPHWQRWKHTALALFIALLVTLLVIFIRKVNWMEVLTAVREYHVGTLALAGACTVATYLVYSGYDLLGCRYAAVRAPLHQAMSIAFVSYACNQNFGALLGTVGLRLRLYTQLGIGSLGISRLILFSVITNWMGYAAVGGVIFVSRLIQVPPQWALGQTVLQLIGVLLLLLVLGYLHLCAFAKRRHISIRGRHFTLPPVRLAIQQVALAALHWPATAGIIYVLLLGRIEFVTVLGTYMLSSVAAVLARIPAGLGVLEGIFIATLGRRIAPAEILAAILAFRAFFNLGALGVAGLVYAALETTLNTKQALPSLSRSSRADHDTQHHTHSTGH